jgi:hypothetical protein
MKKIKTFAFIGIITVAYFCGYMMGFGMCSATTKANAAPAPIVNNVQNTQANINSQIVYVDGQKYVVFTSGYSSMAAVKK